MTERPSISSLEPVNDTTYTGTNPLTGPQPAEFRGQGGEVLLIGAGDVINAMAGTAILEQFDKIHVYDPKIRSIADLPSAMHTQADKFRFLDTLNDAAKLNVDFAYIASPPSHHAEGMDFCMDHGINFVCEKPHFQNPEEGKRITERLATAKSKGFFLDWMPYKEEALNQAFDKPIFSAPPYPDTQKGEGALQRALSGEQPFKLDDVTKITHRFTEGSANVLAVRQDTPRGSGSLEDNMVHILAALGVKGIKLGSIDKATVAQKTEHPGIYKPIGNGNQTTGENYAHIQGKSTSGIALDLLIAKFAEEGRDEQTTTYEFKDKSKLTFNYNTGEMTYSKNERVVDRITVNMDPYALAFHDARHLMKSPQKSRYQEEALATVNAIKAMHDAGRAKEYSGSKHIAMYRDTPNPEQLPISAITLGSATRHGTGDDKRELG